MLPHDAADETANPAADAAPPADAPEGTPAAPGGEPDMQAGAAAEVDGAAFARLYGEPLLHLPTDLYIPPDALEIFLDAFEGPLDLLLYLIRRQNFNIL